MAGLGGGETERLPEPEMEIGEPQLLAAGARELERPAHLLIGAEAEERVMASARGPDMGRQGLQQLHERQGLPGPERHGDGHALALDQAFRGHLAADLPRLGGRLRAPPGGEHDDQGHRHEHELGPAGENAEEESPADERDEGEVQGGRMGAHDGSVTGAGT